ncbi:Prolycopene isomerase, chloroplastic [Gossypium arboreum]|uniref:Prolycopene isomerase, chloroplastic n=1 Tax=Gossypium arboreum TaxID=29729 RepID=A0A0B0P8R7_GOSAR|nr:Prolycopene isomerase, chloroplastic [Gossypium arboreum]
MFSGGLADKKLGFELVNVKAQKENNPKVNCFDSFDGHMELGSPKHLGRNWNDVASLFSRNHECLFFQLSHLTQHFLVAALNLLSTIMELGLPLFPGIKFPTSRNTVLARSSPNNLSQFSSNASSSTSISVKPPTKTVPGKPEADVVVIGSGIGGLCCAGLLARYNQDVLVLESHDLPGGAAHSFEIKGYKFDSGPSLFSGFQSRGPQANPLAQVLDALGESIPCAKYDSWMVYIPEAEFLSRIGPTEFLKDLEKHASRNAVQEWKKLLEAILPLSAAAMALPPLSIRGDLGVISTAAARYAPSLLKSFVEMGPQGAFGAPKLLRPFSEIMDSLELRDPFIRNWVDLLAFLLAGVKSNGILSAEMVYMFAEWYKPGCTLEYPLNGSGAIIDALVRGIQKFGGRISLGSHVEKIIVENGKATGVKLKGGQFIRAKMAIVSNASMWDTLNLLPKDKLPKSYIDRVKTTPQCESFMHLHLGFDAEDVREDLGIHHIVVNEWERGVDADQNVVLISVPSVLSPNLAPPGKHVLHAYTPGTEPFELWEGLDRRSAEYKKLKAERSEVMWKAVERALGSDFNRDKCEVKLVGTPLTHQRFLRRNRGTYGPAIQAGQGTFPGHSTPIPQLYCCGDSTFPGIGVPAVAASGAIVANSLVSVSQHSQLLDAIGI